MEAQADYLIVQDSYAPLETEYGAITVELETSEMLAWTVK